AASSRPVTPGPQCGPTQMPPPASGSRPEMRGLIQAALDRSRTTLLLFASIILAGLATWQVIPKEANPDVPIPMIYVSLALEGVRPEEGARLMVRPREQELRGIA